MTGSDEAGSSVTQVGKLEFSDPLYLHVNDTTGVLIVGVELKGTENYSTWSRATWLALNIKNKISFINGSCKKSDSDVVLSAQ